MHDCLCVIGLRPGYDSVANDRAPHFIAAKVRIEVMRRIGGKREQHHDANDGYRHL